MKEDYFHEVELFDTRSFDFHHALLLITSSVVTASLASFSLGVVMILVVIGRFSKLTR
jgi:hypothetical protein